MMAPGKQEKDLIPLWFKNLGQSSTIYKEPVLSTKIVTFLKQLCDAFDQDTHVFVMAIEVAEEYLRAKKRLNQTVEDPVLLFITMTFVCHKCEGAPESLKVKHVQDLLFHFRRKLYRANEILQVEMDIIKSLEGKLPVTTAVDDLDIIIEKYANEDLLGASIRPVCSKILEFLFIQRPAWFKEMKSLYSQNKDCIVVFHHLYSSKFYLPVCVLLAALELTPFRQVVNTDVILISATKHTKIHEDHIRIFVGKILEMLN